MLSNPSVFRQFYPFFTVSKKPLSNSQLYYKILQVSPTIREDELDKYYKQGFRQFHCSNTLPTPKGGLSGEALMPYNKQIIGYLKENYKDVEVIGGGGIKTWKDVETYKEWGADHVAISTTCFNPWMLAKLYIEYLKNL